MTNRARALPPIVAKLYPTNDEADNLKVLSEMAKDDMVVTAEWLKRWRTPNGGWTAEQLAAIGVPWPPLKGWLTKMAGRTITAEQAQTFQRGWRLRQRR